MSLTNRFPVVELEPSLGRFPVAPQTIIYWGNMAALNAQGQAVPATDAAGLTVAGIALPTTVNTGGTLGGTLNPFATLQPLDADNTHGTAGALTVPVRRGIFRLRNSAAAPLAVGDLGAVAVVEDPETVAKTSTHAVAAGVVLAVTTSEVWVWFVPAALRGFTLGGSILGG